MLFTALTEDCRTLRRKPRMLALVKWYKEVGQRAATHKMARLKWEDEGLRLGCVTSVL